MRRIYFLLPDVETARKVVEELLLSHVEERHMHLVAREGTTLEGLPEAGLAQTSDLIPSLEKGATVGGAAGAVAGLVAVTVPPAGIVLGGGAVLALTVAGAGFGAWMSSMLGVDTPNSQIRRFQEAIDEGQILMMVDVRKDRVREVEEVIRSHHADVKIEGTEPNIPNFP
ncbi:DUF1269 domain-containing protein [Ectothiorhodospiraceae bacterium WFHF3C12]|nr:DUF1269 domain-containing protein [Ectothiorhodospiraceae bacterium WFHF3C12]